MGLLETTAEIARIASRVANPELVQETLKANSEALLLSRENLELQKQVGDLQKKLDDLQGQLDLTKRVYRLNGFVYLDGDHDPCCSACWDKSRKLIHILVPTERCPVCGTLYMQGIPQNPSRCQAGAVPAS